jgi:hypothetical protein
MKKIRVEIVLLLATLLASPLFGQGTQISGSQIKDGAITNAKISASALIDYTKINFTLMPPSIVNAENPLTFNTPLSRTSNTISLTFVPVTLGGTGLTSVTAGRLLFGGNSTTLGTSANLAFDSGTNAFTVTGSGHFTTTLTVGTTTSFNGKVYTWPAGYTAGAVLTDAAGNGTLSWAVPAASGAITLQAADPGTPDTGGLNISGKGFFGSSVHMLAHTIYFDTLGTDLFNYVKYDAGTNRMQMFGNSGINLGSTSIGTPAISVVTVAGPQQLIVTPERFNTITAGNVEAAYLAVGGAPTVTPTGTTGAATYTYQVRAVLADGSGTFGAPQFTATGNATLDGTNYNLIVWTPVTGAYSYDVFRTVSTGTPSSVGKINSGPVYNDSFADTGLAGAGGPDPADNTGIVKARFHATTLGTPIATGATIVPTGSIFHITDAATPIDNIAVPYTGFVGSITLIPEATFSITTSGNVNLGSTAVINKALIMTYDGTKWYPSY